MYASGDPSLRDQSHVDMPLLHPCGQTAHDSFHQDSEFICRDQFTVVNKEAAYPEVLILQNVAFPQKRHLKGASDSPIF